MHFFLSFIVLAASTLGQQVDTSSASLSPPIKWDVDGSGAAIHVNKNSPVVLYSNPTASKPGSASFGYTKLEETQEGLVDVYLGLDSNDKAFGPIQEGFTMARQTCSCYWIDVTDLIKKYPEMRMSSKYSLTFSSSLYNLQSGFFTIDIPSADKTQGGQAKTVNGTVSGSQENTAKTYNLSVFVVAAAIIAGYFVFLN